MDAGVVIFERLWRPPERLRPIKSSAQKQDFYTVQCLRRFLEDLDHTFARMRRWRLVNLFDVCTFTVRTPAEHRAAIMAATTITGNLADIVVGYALTPLSSRVRIEEAERGGGQSIEGLDTSEAVAMEMEKEAEASVEDELDMWDIHEEEAETPPDPEALVCTVTICWQALRKRMDVMRRDTDYVMYMHDLSSMYGMSFPSLFIHAGSVEYNHETDSFERDERFNLGEERSHFAKLVRHALQVTNTITSDIPDVSEVDRHTFDRNVSLLSP
jgi:hypothetical protein